jgi:hypothetical protein
MRSKLLNIFRSSATAIFVLLGFFFFLKFVDPSLIEFKQQPLFLVGTDFLRQFLAYPGGITEYVNLFITQFFVSKFAGSMIIAIILGISVFLSNRILRKYGNGNTIWLVQFIPAILLISLHTHYNIDWNTDVVLLTVLLFTWLFQRISDRKLMVKLPVLIFSLIVLYYLFGGTALLAFTIFVIAIEIIGFKKNSWYISIPVVIVLALLLPYMTSINSAYLNLKMALVGIIETAKEDKIVMILQLSVLGILPLSILLSPFGNFICTKIKLKQSFAKIIDYSFPVLLVAITGLVIHLSFNQFNKDNLIIHFDAKNGDWNKVLNDAEKLLATDRKVLFQINRALYHQGRLVDEAFNYSQVCGEHGLILTVYYNKDVLMECSDLYFDMGHIKESLHWAYEAQTKFDKSPDVLKRIVLCNLLTGDYSASQKMLAILSKSVIQRKWARKYSAYLNNESLIAGDQELAGKRKLMPYKDFYANNQHPIYDLSMLISQHPENKMAFEYLMVDAMLIHDLTKVALNFKYLEKLGYKKIPIHIEEVLVLFNTLNKEHHVDLGKYQISRTTQEKFIAYSKLLMKYRQNHKEVQTEMYNKFGNTFWYYLQFVSPITTKSASFKK